MIIDKTKVNILIVDDEKGLRFGVQRLLMDEGYSVDTAENGEEGIKRGTSKDYDVAVIDLKMPDYDGLEVLQRIIEVNPNTMCFIATAYASYDTAIQSTRMGAFGYIPKPFSPEELIYQVEQGIKQRALLVEAEKLKIEREEKLLELTYEKSQLNAIIKSISDGVLVINKLGEVVYYNYAALKYLNISELKIGYSAFDKLPQKLNDIIVKIYESETVLLKTYSTEIELKPNNELIVEAAVTPVPHPDGSIKGVVIVISNITQFKKIELIKSQFVSMVAHELKTPLAAVQGFINVILDDSLNVSADQQKDYLKRSVLRLNSLKDLVNDLLDISRMELKTKSREIESLNIEEIITNTVQLLELETEKRKLTVVKDIEPNIPRINADHNEITRLITNLLSNAIKYNKENGKIYISAKVQDSYLNIIIKDSGIGMKPEEKARLFNEFFRAKNEKTRGISGTGLGLTIVKRIVDSYHGKIEVESEYGSGTSFIINLPL
jgi:PAS domain S-box-containing protein